MKKKTFRTLGLILITLGIFIIIIQPLSPTGAVIDLSTTPSKISFTIGLILIAIGFIILKFGESALERYAGSKPTKSALRSKPALRKHNKEARHFAKKAYIEEYGKPPNKQELRKYMREHHEQGSLHEEINRYKKAG